MSKLDLKPNPAGPEVVFQIRLEPELHFVLEERADAEGVTPSEMVRRILRKHLPVEKRKRA